MRQIYNINKLPLNMSKLDSKKYGSYLLIIVNNRL